MSKTLTAALALGFLACHKSDGGEPATWAKPKPVHVDLVKVETRAMPSTVLVAGQLKANQESDLAANASGLVTQIMVERGSYVHQGQAIAQLDTRMQALGATEAEAAADTARAQREAAEEECARYKRLFERGIITQEEFDRQTTSCKTAVTSAKAAESRHEQAKQTLTDATIRAPFSGLVSERLVNRGEYVRPDTRVAHIVDIDPLRLELTIPEDKMGAVKQGQAVDFQVAAFPNQFFHGTVEYIGPAVRATSRDLVFEAIVPNSDKVLRPGLFATARLAAGVQELPVVPKTAILADSETARVFAVIEGHIEERIVQVGPEQGDWVAVLKGVSAGEQVVAHPGGGMSDGAMVN